MKNLLMKGPPKSNILIYTMVVIFITSCGIFGYSVDRPAPLLNFFIFQESYEKLQEKTDVFVENSSLIERYYKKGYDKNEYRKYRMKCDNDTLIFHVVFSGNDTLSRIGVTFFKLHSIPFKTSDRRESKKQIKKNQHVHDICQKCYENMFIKPLAEKSNLKYEKIW